MEDQKAVLDMLSLRGLLDIQMERVGKQAIEYSNLQFREEVWAGDRNFSHWHIDIN